MENFEIPDALNLQCLSKNLAKTQRMIETNLENRIKTLEQNLKNEEDFNAFSLW